MNQQTTDSFFRTLPVFTHFEGVTNLANYHALPLDWALATADIVDSTGAIENGRYKSVNMAGAGVISAILNALGQHDLPFVFGGDGALVAIPPGSIDLAHDALAAVQVWVREELDLTLRAALVPVAEVHRAGLDVRVARFQVSVGASYAMFSGGGASWAEARMKEGLYGVTPAPAGTRPDLSGLSCRWNPIQSRHGEMVSIIALPGPTATLETFSALVAEIVALVSAEEREGHPIAESGPTLGLSSAGIEAEARAQAPKTRRLRQKLFIIAQYFLTVTAYRLKVKLGSFDAVEYRRDVGRNSDFRKFDDGLKMTVDIDPARRARIEARLEQAAAIGICRYGLHKQESALMTCIVPTPVSDDHMHFIDGAAGGYAMAASQLKRNAAAVTVVTP